MMQTAVRAVYPPQCLSCAGMVETDFGLCGPCWRETRFISGTICDLCGTPLPGDGPGPEHCDDCLTIARPWARGRAALVYAGTGRRLVLALKHGDRHDIARPAAQWMARVLRPVVPPDVLVVPVPLHLWRLAGRRFNQSALLAQAIAHHIGTDCCADALLRPKRTASLDGKTRDARFDTLSGAIVTNLRRSTLIVGRPVLIVDDVMTSGATLAACADALQQAGAGPIFTGVLARVVKDA